MTAEPGKVLSFQFTHYDLETCCDYVTIYDGPTDIFPILARFGGPNSTEDNPSKIYFSSTRKALVTFQSNEVIQKTGFSFNYFSVWTASPCNRDIVLNINAMADLGSQDNFLKELDFIAHKLTPTWQVGPSKTDVDYAVVWGSDTLSNNSILSETVMGLADYIGDVMDNNNTDFECIIKYSENAVSEFGKEDLLERDNIQKVVIAFVAADPKNAEDLYEGIEFAHELKYKDDSKLIVVGLGSGLNQSAISRVAYADGFSFYANYDKLDADFASKINAAICQNQPNQCGP
ncbi:hypothetical protein WR25_15258 [Diploscapter pachys]|uniref:CUB domain-containing protein n=1 Tax=Diploscapter pachys TaxID=2018661 RepID=A0A2A2KUG7_9BILA|nr:hypothetical protein WR25_15258 [Diploscapter pachys]